MRIAFVGDVMLGRLVSRELHRRAPETFWTDVGPLLWSCDAVIANLECAVTRHREAWAASPKAYHFRADPKAVAVLKAGNIRAVSLANNHVLDFGFVGLRDTLKALDDAGIAHAGAGEDAAAARRPALFAVGSLGIALLACVDHEEPFAADATRPGTAYVDAKGVDESAFPDDPQIAALRQAGADLVVLSTHFGPNMVQRPSSAIARYRRTAARRGVDIVFGHSAHLVQGVERCGASLILHDTGDFLDDYAVDPALRNDWSFVFVVEADKAGLRKLTLVPVLLEFARVRLAGAAEAEPLLDRMTRLSADFATQLVRDGDALTLALRADVERHRGPS